MVWTAANGVRQTTKLSTRTSAFLAAFLLAISSLATTVSPFVEHAFATSPAVDISTKTQLCDAIQNQADGQTWNIAAGTYALDQCNTIDAGGQTGWYFPITASNLTINGVGNPTIYGTGFTANGAHHTQNFVTVFGDNVTIDGLTLMPKVEPNKTIEVLGNGFTLRNSTIAPNTLTDSSEYDGITNAQDRSDERDWGGSVYFSNTGGTETLDNVTIENGGISDHATGSTLNMSGVTLSYDTDVDWINAYRFASHGNTVNGAPQVIYHVSSSLGNLDSVLANMQDGDTIELDSDLTTSKEVTLNKAVTLNGNGHTLNAHIDNSSNSTSNNAAVGILSDNVTINNLTEDGNGSVNTHGINVYRSTGVNLNDVTIKNNTAPFMYGLVVNASKVTVNTLTTSGNFGSVDVDKGNVTNPATLTVNGTSTHDDSPILSGIFVDHPDVYNTVVDNDNQYTSAPFFSGTLYILNPADTTAPSVPTLVSPVNRGYEKTNDFYFDWTDSTDNSSSPLTYEFQSSQNPHTTNGVLDSSVWNSLANGQTLTDSKIHSTGAPDGTWYWQARAVDASGNKSAWTPVWKMTLDTGDPTASLAVSHEANGLVNSRQYGNKLTVTGHATDNLGMNRVLVQLLTSKHGAIENHTVYLSGTDQDWSTSFDAKGLGLTDGNYSVVAVVTDSAGNTSAKGQYHDFALDNTKPTIEFVDPSPVDGAWENGNFDVTLHAHDNNKLNYVNVSLRDNTKPVSEQYKAGCNFANLDVNDAVRTCNIKLPANLPDGTYTVQIGGQDQAGLWTVNASRTVKIQRALPAAPTALNFKFQYDSSDVTNPYLYYTSKSGGNNLEMYWSAPNGWVTGYQVKVDYPNGDSYDLNNDGYQGSNPYAWIASTFGKHGQGAYVYSVRAHNPNGWSSWSDVATLYYDTQSPTASFTQTPPAYVNGNFWVEATASDNVALKDAFFDVRDAGGWVAGCVPGTFTSTPATIAGSTSVTLKCQINTSKLADGQTYTLRVHDGDMTSHYGGGQSVQITVDRTAPVISVKNATWNDPTVVALSDGSVVSTVVNKNLRLFTDESNIDYVTMDGSQKWSGSWITGAGGIGIAYITSGTHTFQAFDKAGNPSNMITLNFDNVGPALTVSEPASDKTISLSQNGYTTDGTLTSEVNGSGVNRVVLYVTDSNGDRAYRGVTKAFGPNGEWSVNVPTGALTDGTYTFNFNAYDNAGNHTTIRHTVVVDSAAPTVTITPYSGTNATPKLTGTVDDPNANVFVTIDGSTYAATNNLDGTWGLNVATPLSLGNHPASVVATDAAGNTSPAATTTLVVSKVVLPDVASVQRENNARGGRGGNTNSFSNLTNFALAGNGGSVLGDSTTDGNNTDDQGQVKADTTTNTDPVANTGDPLNQCTKFFGLCWYYWVPIVVVVLAALYWLFRPRTDNKAA